MKLSVNPDKRQEKGGGLEERNSPAVVDGEASGVHEGVSIFEILWLASQDHSSETVNSIPEHFFLVLRFCFVFPVQVHLAQGWQEGEVVLCSKTAAPHVIISAASSDQDCDLA